MGEAESFAEAPGATDDSLVDWSHEEKAAIDLRTQEREGVEDARAAGETWWGGGYNNHISFE